MKVIVVSDSHGKVSAIQAVLEQYPQAELFLHCGDIEAEPQQYPQLVTVRGNNDIFYDYPEERVVTVGKHRIYVVHSHQFMYSRRVEQLAQKAKSLACDIVCYGHTHIAAYEVVDGVHVLNPGSLWRSRDGRGPSYAVVELEGDNVDVEFKFLPQSKSNFFW